jgi:hypothetical protein
MCPPYLWAHSRVRPYLGRRKGPRGVIPPALLTIPSEIREIGEPGDSQVRPPVLLVPVALWPHSGHNR